MLTGRQLPFPGPVAFLRQRDAGRPARRRVGGRSAIPGQHTLPQWQSQLPGQVLRQQFGLIIPPVAFPLRRHGHIGHGGQLLQQAALPHRFRQHPAKKRQAFPHALKFQLLHPGAKGPLIPGAP